MKLNYEFVMREIAGEKFLVPVGEAASVFDGIITINELGAFIFENFSNCESAEKIAEKITLAYDVDYETALADVNAFISSLGEAGIKIQ